MVPIKKCITGECEIVGAINKLTGPLDSTSKNL